MSAIVEEAADYEPVKVLITLVSAYADASELHISFQLDQVLTEVS